MDGKVKLHFKNQLGVNIMLSSGIDIERELKPEEKTTIEASDGDCVYLDYGTEAEQKEAS